MDEMNKDSAAQEATKVAAEVAAEASRTAREVAQRAAETAAKVAESVLVFGNDLGYIKNDIKEIKDLLSTKYITVEAFDPVKKIVYGLVGITLMSIAGSILAMIITK